MKKYVFIIARTSEIGTTQLSELTDLHFAGDPRVNSFEFEAPPQCSDSIVALIGRGLAFGSGYNSDGTISLVINVDIAA